MKGTTKNEGNKVNYDVKVLKSKEIKEGTCAITLEVNGIKIYNCFLKEGTKNGKDWKMVTLPSNKGKDNNYYNTVWFPISKELTEDIYNQACALLK